MLLQALEQIFLWGRGRLRAPLTSLHYCLIEIFVHLPRFFSGLHFLASCFLLFFNKFISCIYLWLVLGLCCCTGFSLVEASRGYSSVQSEGFPCCGAQAPGPWASVAAACGLSSCGPRALEHRQYSWGMGLVALQPVGSSPDQRLNPHLLHWLEDSLPLSHQGSPSIPFLLSHSGQVLSPHWASFSGIWKWRFGWSGLWSRFLQKTKSLSTVQPQLVLVNTVKPGLLETLGGMRLWSPYFLIGLVFNPLSTKPFPFYWEYWLLKYI